MPLSAKSNLFCSTVILSVQDSELSHDYSLENKLLLDFRLIFLYSTSAEHLGDTSLHLSSVKRRYVVCEDAVNKWKLVGLAIDDNSGRRVTGADVWRRISGADDVEGNIFSAGFFFRRAGHDDA